MDLKAQHEEAARHKREMLKIRVAIFFGYNGSTFQGSQVQKETDNTIEYQLEKALLDSGLLPPRTYKNPRASQWNRGSRTDKGVHALSNTIAVKLEAHIKYVDGHEPDQPKEKNKERLNYARMVEAVNAQLDTSIIKVMDMKPVLPLFDVKKYASERLYHYVAPLDIFRPEEEKQPLDREQAENLMEKVSFYLKKYEGTKRFHNYTVKVQATDDQAKRTIKEITCHLVDSGQPVLLEDTPVKKVKQEEEQKVFRWWVSIDLKGSSFMYHQIRKMVGNVIQCLMQNKGEEFFNYSFMNNKMNLWLAPPDGLYLHNIFFRGYNKREDCPCSLEFSPEALSRLDSFYHSVVLKEILGRSSRFEEWRRLVGESEWDLEEF